VPFENLSLLLAVFLSRSHKAAQECHFDYTIIIASRCLVNKKGGSMEEKAALAAWLFHAVPEIALSPLLA
jgi:hypothetical protein